MYACVLDTRTHNVDNKAVHKNNCFQYSGQVAKRGATGNIFFHFSKNGQYFPTKKKSERKKKIAAGRLASILATPWTGNRLFLMDSLKGAIHLCFLPRPVLLFAPPVTDLCIQQVGVRHVCVPSGNVNNRSPSTRRLTFCCSADKGLWSEMCLLL